MSKLSNSILLSVLSAVYVTVRESYLALVGALYREKVILWDSSEYFENFTNLLTPLLTVTPLTHHSSPPEWGHGTPDTEHHSPLTIIFIFGCGYYNSINGDHNIALHSSHTHPLFEPRQMSNITYRSAIVLSEKKRKWYSMARRKRPRMPGSSQGLGAGGGIGNLGEK